MRAGMAGTRAPPDGTVGGAVAAVLGAAGAGALRVAPPPRPPNGVCQGALRRAAGVRSMVVDDGRMVASAPADCHPNMFPCPQGPKKRCLVIFSGCGCLK